MQAEEANRDQQPAAAAHAGGHGFAWIAEAERLTWGTNAVALKSPWSNPPSLAEMLADREHTVVLSRFYRAGSDPRPATPTECRVAYSSDALFLIFRCEERDMSFPYANLDAHGWPAVNWYALHGLPSGSRAIWPPYPDEVDVLIQPEVSAPSYYQFAATPQGLKLGCNLQLGPHPDVGADQAAAARGASISVSKIEAFQASVLTRANEWLVFLQIPWQTLGGEPKPHFGFLPLRTRWRDGEFSSPAAIDLNERMPVDLLIETHLSGTAQVRDSQRSLCTLPSGILRWQRPAVLTYPDAATRQQIWQLESSLSAPTDKENLAQRLYLTQRWMDLMTQEGFTPLPRSWGILANDLTLAFFRQRVNAAFQKNDFEQAYQLLDTYLSQLDQMSRWWYADNSPGNILSDQWKPVTHADSLDVRGDTLLMRCVAGGHDVNLRLALPASGGIRIYGDNEGYWKPAELLPLNVTQSGGAWSIKAGEGNIVLHRTPFSIAFHDAAGKQVTQIGAGKLALRFGADGKILAVDFRNQLAADEVIYGFGKKYDDFNENGRVLTLWGTDDWIGNGEGFANTSYKPLPIFHSSRGYMAFSNSSYRLRADVGKADPGQYRLTQQGPIFHYYFWMGAPEKILSSYSALTGRPPLPPKWAFEPWMSRGGQAWASGRLHNAIAEEESVAKRFAELDIPHSAIYAEGPSALSPQLNQFMAARGIRVLGYFMPAISPTRQASLMPELKPDELPILQCGSEGQARALGYVNFTNPNARELCRRALRPALELGEAGSMVDYGDLVPDNAVFHDGQHGAEMHNFYYYDYQRTVSEVFREKRGNDFILYARGAAPGTQAWLGQFAGDHPANFEGLKHVLTGAMNLCACGYSAGAATWADTSAFRSRRCICAGSSSDVSAL